MGFKDLLKLKEKENRIYLILVVWLLIGFVFMQFLPLVGIFIYLPFLTFLFFLYLISIFWKKNIKEYSISKIILVFIISVPLIFILSLVFIVLFIFAILSYLFFTSWFTLYGCYLAGQKTDKNLYKFPLQRLTRSTVFIGGFVLSIILLIGFFTGSLIITIYSKGIPPILNLVFIVIGVILIGFYCVCSFYLFKKVYNAWLGIFFILVVIYTFFLVLKVILGLSGTEGETSFQVKMLLIFVDLFILLYALSTIMGEQAEILTEKIKLFSFFSVDTALIWLIFAKACYEFAANFPYDILSSIPFDFIGYVIVIGSELDLIKNIIVLALFVLLLIIIGSYEIRKHILMELEIRKEVKEDVKELTSYDQKKYKKDIVHAGEDVDADTADDVD